MYVMFLWTTVPLIPLEISSQMLGLAENYWPALLRMRLTPHDVPAPCICFLSYFRVTRPCTFISFIVIHDDDPHKDQLSRAPHKDVHACSKCSHSSTLLAQAQTLLMRCKDGRWQRWTPAPPARKGHCSFQIPRTTHCLKLDTQQLLTKVTTPV